MKASMHRFIDALDRTASRPIMVQTPACDRCSVGVMDAENPHLYGECDCECHASRATEREDKQAREGQGD